MSCGVLGSRHRIMEQRSRGSHYWFFVSALREFKIIRFDFLVHYADKLYIVAQLNGCASSTSQAYARRGLCVDVGLTLLLCTRLSDAKLV